MWSEYVGRARSFHVFSGSTAFLASTQGHSPEALLPHSRGVFWRLYHLGAIDRIIDIGDRSQSPAPLPWTRSGSGTESSKRLITWLAPLAASPTLWCFPKVTSLTEQETLYCPHLVGNSKGFRGSVSKTGTQILFQIYIYYKSQYHPWQSLQAFQEGGSGISFCIFAYFVQHSRFFAGSMIIQPLSHD